MTEFSLIFLGFVLCVFAFFLIVRKPKAETDESAYVNIAHLQRQHNILKLVGYCANCECSRKINVNLRCSCCGSKMVQVDKLLNKEMIND